MSRRCAAEFLLCLTVSSLFSIADCAQQGSLTSCGRADSPVVVDSIGLDPAVPKTGADFTLEIRGHVESGIEHLDVKKLHMVGSLFYCRRVADCMEVFKLERALCTTDIDGTKDICNGSAKPGKEFRLQQSWQIPLLVFRGSYHMNLKIVDPAHHETAISCYTLSGVEVLASRLINKWRDMGAAIIAFLVASSSSRQLGGLFPKFSGGILPQISGFLCMGIVVGPYMTNLVSKQHIFLLGSYINRLSLAFIAGAAGAEIFLPELRELLATMALQVVIISFSTLVLVCAGLLVLTSFGVVTVSSLDDQPTGFARFAVALLTATLMVARSPASAIAVIHELGVGETKVAKTVLGVTVLSDVSVLILFAVCSKVVHVATEGGSFGPGALVGVSTELLASCLLGLVAGQILRFVLPADGGKAPGEVADDKQTFLIALRGASLLAVLYTTFVVAEELDDWTAGRVKLEPLLACTVASCVCGHDELRRERLCESLSLWTPPMLLPFFTLAGASLDLPGLCTVFPAAVALVILRMLGIAVGSSSALLLERKIWPQLNTSPEAVKFMWTGLLAQAGVTLGLVLEVQASFPSWGPRFGTLIIGVVVLNQLLGPVMCRVGVDMVAKAELGGAAYGKLKNESEGAGSLEVVPTAVDEEGPQREISAEGPRSARARTDPTSEEPTRSTKKKRTNLATYDPLS
eukprot:TRINITY_DN111915_c0_g1_i1.p1 TRINITY_DN111915_c0_g1~~TRINITY_DN111915_c0_g1_i1.p1  ORF type:complete len:690 (+),score=94.23 TRINITY_DN111915_c0_g1_i1:91-2160(+)